MTDVTIAPPHMDSSAFSTTPSARNPSNCNSDTNRHEYNDINEEYDPPVSNANGMREDRPTITGVTTNDGQELLPSVSTDSSNDNILINKDLVVEDGNLGVISENSAHNDVNKNDENESGKSTSKEHRKQQQQENEQDEEVNRIAHGAAKQLEKVLDDTKDLATQLLREMTFFLKEVHNVRKDWRTIQQREHDEANRLDQIEPDVQGVTGTLSGKSGAFSQSFLSMISSPQMNAVSNSHATSANHANSDKTSINTGLVANGSDCRNDRPTAKSKFAGPSGA